MSEVAPRHGRVGVLIACCTALYATVVTAFTTPIALPSIAEHFGSTVQSLQWVLSAYILAIASVLLLTGSLADRFGRRRILLIGLSAFTVGALLCAIAPTDGALIAARVVQGLGSGLIIPSGLGLVGATFRGPDLAKGMAWWAAMGGAGLATGPLLGGALIDVFGWSSVFWFTLPISIVAAALVILNVTESRSATPRKLHPTGQALIALGFASIAFAVIQSQTWGWMSPPVLAASIAALVSFVVLVLVERRRADPLIPPTLARDTHFLSALFTGLLGFAALGGFIFTVSLYLQSDRALQATQTGLFFAAVGVAGIAASLLSGRFVARGLAHAVLIVSGLLVAAAAVALILLQEAPVEWMLLPLALFGFGYGLINDPVNSIAASSLPVTMASLGGSMVATARQFGQILGIAAAGGLITATTGATLGTGLEQSSTHVWMLLACLGVAMIVINLAAAIRGRRDAVAEAASTARVTDSTR